MPTVAFFENKQSFLLETQLGNPGGEGTVYLASDGSAIKVFNPKTNIQIKENKIDLLMASGIYDDCICFPEKKTYDEKGKFMGYSMKSGRGNIMQTSVFIRPGLNANFPDWNRINLANLALTI